MRFRKGLIGIAFVLTTASLAIGQQPGGKGNKLPFAKMTELASSAYIKAKRHYHVGCTI